jgi:large subunit ribosomal protein L29
MSLPKARDLRSLSAQELEHKRAALEKELHDLRQKKITGQLEKPHQFKVARRQVAQINTIMREKKND